MREVKMGSFGDRGDAGQALRRGLAIEAGESHFVLRDVRVAERPVLVSESGRFRLEAIVEEVASEADGEERVQPRPVLAGEPTPPLAFSLSQNYPNPFNPSTTIAFSVPDGGSGMTSLQIYDVRGRLVQTLVDGEMSPGNYQVHWDGRTDHGEAVSSGVYLYKLQQGEKVQTRKMTVVR